MIKRSKKILNILLIATLCISTFYPLSTVEAAEKKLITLQDHKDALEDLIASKEENNRLTSESMAKIDQKRNAIENANNTIASNEGKVEDSKTLVSESQEKIKLKQEELKDVLVALQYTDSNDKELYTDYIFSAGSISEMMERKAVVAQVVDYTQAELDSLDKLIKDNEKLQDKLAKDNENLNNSITDYERQVEELEKYISERATIGMNYDQQIKSKREAIKLYESYGCKNSDKIEICYEQKLYNNKVNSSEFSRPLTYGVVTQAWGNAGHKGMDIGGNAKGTPVYAPANGTVAAVVNKSSCGGNIIYMHFTVAGKAYTGEFAHLTEIKVKNGQYVTKGTIIGTVGGDKSTWYYDKCTTGAHLHYAIAYGYYLGTGPNGYTKWSTFTANTKATGVVGITGISNTRGYRWNGR